MLWSIAVLLVLLWALGMFTGHTMNGIVYVFLVLAAVAVVIKIITGRRVL